MLADGLARDVQAAPSGSLEEQQKLDAWKHKMDLVRLADPKEAFVTAIRQFTNVNLVKPVLAEALLSTFKDLEPQRLAAHELKQKLRNSVLASGDHAP